jgi:hypothetical protein
MGANAMNTIELSALPELYDILPSDKIYVFTNRNGDYEMNSISFNQLSAYVYSYDIMEKYKERFARLQQLSTDFMKFLDETYPTIEYISAHYITYRQFVDTTDGIITTTDALSIQLQEYATIAYADFAKTKLMKEHEKIRVEMLKDIASDTISYIDLNGE